MRIFEEGRLCAHYAILDVEAHTKLRSLAVT